MPLSEIRGLASPRIITLDRSTSAGLKQASLWQDLDSAQSTPSLSRINILLSRWQLPHDVNEAFLEKVLISLESCGDDGRPRYQLLTARILEAALICAGHYVDNCEFRAAGDLLVNPRQILLYRKGEPQPEIKRRHAKLSDQLAPYADHCVPFSVWFRNNVVLQTTKTALIPGLLQRLERFRSFQSAYLATVRERMAKASHTIGYLAAWHLSGPRELNQRMRSASTSMRNEIYNNLCGFSDHDFIHLGREIDLIAQHNDYRSVYLAAN